jgi:hypothetical protein
MQHVGLRDTPRRFGFFRTEGHPNDPPMNFLRNYTPEQLKLAQMLQVIEDYAGYFEMHRPMHCRHCRPQPKIGHREFVFKPLPGGALYRWPEALMHLIVNHMQEIPQWVPELVSDFKLARTLGLWR